MSRAERRSRGKRELRRAITDKKATLMHGYKQGYSANTLAAQLGYSLSQVDELLAFVREREEGEGVIADAPMRRF
jgi:hypothetical protein